MDTLARLFDQPVDSRDHQTLAKDAWMGGDLVYMRYWLGRLLNRNFFRESDDAVMQSLRDHFVASGFKKGSQLVFDYQSWHSLARLIQHFVEMREGQQPTTNPRLVAAIQATLADPELTDSEIATAANTTEKQIARMSEVSILRRLWKQRTA